MKIAKEPCTGCPFLGRITLRKGRLKDILTSVKADDSHFVCHQSLPSYTGRKTEPVTCRGYWDLALAGKAHLGQLPRIALRLDLVEEVEIGPKEPEK